jgi:hypothetical protein
MKCVLCEQKKAKRFCPGKNTHICPQCCGEKRVLEINCPESCEYLKAGREREGEEYSKRLSSLEPAKKEKYQRLLRDYQDVMVHIEYAISRERLLSRDLEDKDVLQAISILLDTYKTEDKGVLYEKTSEDLRVEPLRRELRSIIESFRNPEKKGEQGVVDPQNTRLPLSATIDCLEFIQALIVTYQADRRSASGYVDFLARIIPREETRSSIILP